MKKLIVLTAVLMSTGCSHIIINTLGPIYDSSDKCQLQNSKGKPLPNWCGGSAGSSVNVRDFQNNNILMTIGR